MAEFRVAHHPGITLQGCSKIEVFIITEQPQDILRPRFVIVREDPRHGCRFFTRLLKKIPVIPVSVIGIGGHAIHLSHIRPGAAPAEGAEGGKVDGEGIDGAAVDVEGVGSSMNAIGLEEGGIGAARRVIDGEGKGAEGVGSSMNAIGFDGGEVGAARCVIDGEGVGSPMNAVGFDGGEIRAVRGGKMTRLTVSPRGILCLPSATGCKRVRRRRPSSAYGSPFRSEE